MTQDRFSWEKFRSLPIDGSATLTIDASSTTTNWARASSASASHFRSGASVGLKVVSPVKLVAVPASLVAAGPLHIGSSERRGDRHPLGVSVGGLAGIGTGIPLSVLTIRN